LEVFVETMRALTALLSGAPSAECWSRTPSLPDEKRKNFPSILMKMRISSWERARADWMPAQIDNSRRVALGRDLWVCIECLKHANSSILKAKCKRTVLFRVPSNLKQILVCKTMGRNRYHNDAAVEPLPER
jgi:hypothetical protein